VFTPKPTVFSSQEKSDRIFQTLDENAIDIMMDHEYRLHSILARQPRLMSSPLLGNSNTPRIVDSKISQYSYHLAPSFFDC
jgi:hypothetical protein